MLGGCPASGGASVGASSDNGQGVTRFDVIAIVLIVIIITVGSFIL